MQPSRVTAGHHLAVPVASLVCQDLGGHSCSAVTHDAAFGRGRLKLTLGGAYVITWVAHRLEKTLHVSNSSSWVPLPCRCGLEGAASPQPYVNTQNLLQNNLSPMT
jgi:hypothetical protein